MLDNFDKNVIVMTMKDLKVSMVNAHQLFRLFQEPEFTDFAPKTSATIRSMAVRGAFGDPVVMSGLKNKSILVDLRKAYSAFFVRFIDKEEFITVVNRWSHSKEDGNEKNL